MPPDFIVLWIAWVHKNFPVVGTLLLMIMLDIILGVIVACMTKKLSSSVSHRGMLRKAVKILLVAVGAVLQPYSNGMPLSDLIAMFFIFTEGVSIIENAAIAGVPVPPALLEILKMTKEDKKFTPNNNVQIDSVNITTTEPVISELVHGDSDIHVHIKDKP